MLYNYACACMWMCPKSGYYSDLKTVPAGYLLYIYSYTYKGNCNQLYSTWHKELNCVYICSVPYEYFAHTCMGPSHTRIPIWAAYMHMGYPCSCGIALLNFKLAMILACS